jgi:hypothetical protein
VVELSETLLSLQTALKLAKDLQHARVALDRFSKKGGDSPRTLSSVSPSLRYSGMTVPEAAGLFKLGDEQVRRLLRTHELVGVQFGGRIGWRLDRAYVMEVAAAWEVQRAGGRRARRAGLPRRPITRGRS